jgi:hypothetical protein
MLPDPWSTPSAPLSSPLYSGQTSPGMFGNLLEQMKFLGGDARKNLGAVAKTVGQNPAATSRMGTTALLAGGNLVQGDLLGAATSTLGGLIGGGLASPLGAQAARAIPGPLGKVAQFAIPAVGSLIGATGLEQAGAKAAEYVTAAVPGAPEVSQRSQEQRTREFEREQQRLDYEAMSKAQMAQNRELVDYMTTKSLEYQKAVLPLQERIMRTQLVNQQAINASNASLAQQMGRTATMSRAALANIAEAGATTRTLASQNPYAGSVLQAPQISFG